MIPIALVYSKFYSNHDGLLAFQNNETDAKVLIQDVTAKNNQLFEMYLTGTGISVNNANINSGVVGLAIGPNNVNEVTLAGDVSITNSKCGFVGFSGTQGTVYVTGDVNLNRNGLYGVATYAPDLTIAVGGSYSGKSGKSGSGSLTACDNGVWDIENDGPSTFEGSDYTCERTAGTDLPVCKPCHPGCPSPEPDADESSSHIMSAAFETKELDFADHMDHEEFPL